MLSVRRPRALYGATYGARSMTAWLIAGSQRSQSSTRSTITPPNHCGPVTSSHRCLVVGGHRKLRWWRPAEPPPSGHGVWWSPVTSPERPGRRSPITRRPPEARAGRLDGPAIPNMARLRRLRDSRQTKPLSKAGAMQPCSYRTGIGAAWARTLSGRRYASVAAPCEPDARAGQTRAPPFTGGVPAARLSSGRC
jgi:hypothetical protein